MLEQLFESLNRQRKYEINFCQANRDLGSFSATPPSAALGPLTALAFVLIIGRAERFQCGKQIASYMGLMGDA
ncbi:MAG: hypothetical protein DMG79_19325 [Acidobacteria bacterium]|nr:MAG: hypothetical protein DMG79_19325 [Acidobacteriota bacterium]